MNDYIAVSNALAAAARPCFNDVDRDFVDSALDAGEYFFAVDDALAAAARENFPLPAQLVQQVRGWLDGHDGGVPAAHRERFEQLLDRVTVTPAPATA